MKKRLMLGMAACVAAFGASVFAGDAKDEPKPQMYTIYKDAVIPGKTEAYEAGIKYMLSEFEAYGIDPEKINWKAVSGPEIGYIYVMPIENYAAMDAMHAAWEKAVDTIGKEKFDDMMQPIADAMDHAASFQVVRRPDLSYTPEDSAVDADDVSYVHYLFLYVLPGKTKVVEDAAKEFVALYKAKGAKYGWSVYESISGDDLPVFVIAHPAKSQNEFYRQREELQKLIGDEADPIKAKVRQALRRMEDKDGWIRPDLAYPQQAKHAGDMDHDEQMEHMRHGKRMEHGDR